jgi:hypothetical protein
VKVERYSTPGTSRIQKDPRLKIKIFDNNIKGSFINEKNKMAEMLSLTTIPTLNVAETTVTNTEKIPTQI